MINRHPLLCRIIIINQYIQNFKKVFSDFSSCTLSKCVFLAVRCIIKQHTVTNNFNRIVTYEEFVLIVYSMLDHQI